MVTHTRIPFTFLVFLDDNPRTRTPEGLRQMADDIQSDPTFFENRPVLVNFTDGCNQVYAGDLRAHAAHDVLGWVEIPCIVERDVPADVMRRRAIIDNLHRETWDAGMLASSWAADDLAGWGLTTDKWGDDTETPDAGGYAAREDDYEPPPEIVTDITLGDLFEIGPHRLLCGDSTDRVQVERLMDGEKADMLTDPPYGIKINMNMGRLKGRPKRFEDKDWDKSVPDFFYLLEMFDRKIIWGGNYFADRLPVTKDWLCWSKKMKGLDFAEFELAWSNVGKNARILEHHWSGEQKLHPTMKPVPVIAWCMEFLDLTNIVDPFLGSGTTMVAAHQLNRRCFGMELDPKYCQVIIDRMLKLDPALIITRNGKKYKPTTIVASAEF